VETVCYYGNNRVQGSNRRFVDVENQDFQLRIYYKQILVIVIQYINVT